MARKVKNQPIRTLLEGDSVSGYGLVKYAAGMGVEMSEEDGYRLVNAFREEYHEIPHYWDRLLTVC